MTKSILSTDLIKNAEGSVYHLNLLPSELASNIIMVGDPDRVSLFSKLLDTIEVKKEKREFSSCTGYYNNTRFTIISSGIGLGNIDILLNELDALANIDFNSLEIKEEISSLNLIRIGTCGAFQQEIKVGTPILSQFVIGLDNLASFYNMNYEQVEIILAEQFTKHSSIDCYASGVSKKLYNLFQNDFELGITVVPPGFYAPQGRVLRGENKYEGFTELIQSFRFNNLSIKNLEMEASGLYALSNLLGHQAIAIDVVLANRITQEFKQDYQADLLSVCQKVLDKLSN